ncbi:EAL domain-containing protein [Legionella quateirensis]|uniref:GGDEF domain-containing sensory box protein n=1 Tax=Legionella quateirensis TaxID=45072 RepID=A0A378KQ65_9GAMM|nr:EAL domain-containing protein [Legionella quateirensis]KTD47839.1 GGDEF domain-containing sensory box protein [Legionella quateirensis]STY16733.1 signal transduction protein containing a membrane domain, an EAL and a GGDEF domain [Legionella quateirensis]
MDTPKNKKQTPISNNKVNACDLDNSIKKLISKSQDGIIAFDMQGKVIAMNDEAARLFGKNHNKFINQLFWHQFKLNTYSRKRQFVQARKYFQIAKEGITQHFTWIESISQKPITAFNIMINKTEIHGTSVIFARLINILQEKIIEWVLWSLAQISNHSELNAIIDDILKIINDAFSADYASVCLVDSQQIAHTVSYYSLGKKEENISYSLKDSPCNQVILQKSICHFNNIQQSFPEDKLLAKMKVNSYLAGPIINAQNDVVGLLSILTFRKLETNNLNDTLFRLFLGRINLEFERLLNQRRLQFLASIPKQDPNPVIRIQPAGEVIFANNQGKIILKQWRDQHEGIPEQLLREAHRARDTNQVLRIELEADSKVYLFTLIWMVEFKQINIYGTDITQLKSTEQNMLNLTRYDTLTQIANRKYFEEQLIEKMYEHQLDGKNLGLLLIDLDNFKIINDTLGHPIGDRLLKAATKRMVRCIRQDDFIARIGGDEFIVLIKDATYNSTKMIAEKIINVLSRSFQFGEYQMKISASIGIALFPESGETSSELLQHADLAMYQAKKSGKNNFAFFSSSLHFIQDKRNDIIKKELKLAVAKNELYIDYQPQIDIISNKIIGFEALLRWLHPQEGLILPGEFIPIAEQTGCIHLISQWLIEQSLQDYQSMLNSKFDGKLSINISLTQLNDARFLDSLNDNLEQYNIVKNQIILDISERVIAPYFNKIAKYLRKIHKNGIKICLDNFGSPQVSLPKLLSLPLDYLKLDQQLLTGIGKSAKNRMLLNGIIQLTKALNIDSIQKGIETEQQHEIIKSVGCQYAQGYFYCKPISILEVHKFISNFSATD